MNSPFSNSPWLFLLPLTFWLVGCSGQKEESTRSVTEQKELSKPEDDPLVAETIRKELKEVSKFSLTDFYETSRVGFDWRAFDSQPLTLAILLLPRFDRGTQSCEQEYSTLSQTSLAADIAQLLLESADGRCCNIVQERFIDSMTCRVSEDKAEGEVGLFCSNLFRVKFRFQAVRQEEKWKLVRFYFPAHCISVERTTSDEWKIRQDFSVHEGVNDQFFLLINVKSDSSVEINGETGDKAVLESLINKRKSQLQAFGHSINKLPILMTCSSEAKLNALEFLSNHLGSIKIEVCDHYPSMKNQSFSFQLINQSVEDLPSANDEPDKYIGIVSNDMGTIETIWLGKRLGLRNTIGTDDAISRYVDRNSDSLVVRVDSRLKFYVLTELIESIEPLRNNLRLWILPATKIGPQNSGPDFLNPEPQQERDLSNPM